jgi:hypothetical protein
MTEPARIQRNTAKVLELHPVFGARIVKLIAAMEAVGYRPRIQQAYRSIEEQQANVTRGVSEVVWSFHNATDPDGKPAALAVDMLDDDSPLNPRKAYLMRLAIECRPLSLQTGILWGLADGPRQRLSDAIEAGRVDWVGSMTGWDPLHVQCSDVTLAQAKHGVRPKETAPASMEASMPARGSNQSEGENAGDSR